MYNYRSSCCCPTVASSLNAYSRKMRQYILKVSGPCVETSCVFLCTKNIINAEMGV